MNIKKARHTEQFMYSNVYRKLKGDGKDRWGDDTMMHRFEWLMKL